MRVGTKLHLKFRPDGGMVRGRVGVGGNRRERRNARRAEHAAPLVYPPQLAFSRNNVCPVKSAKTVGVGE